jgi:hypothetical protein
MRLCLHTLFSEVPRHCTILASLHSGFHSALLTPSGFPHLHLAFLSLKVHLQSDGGSREMQCFAVVTMGVNFMCAFVHAGDN